MPHTSGDRVGSHFGDQGSTFGGATGPLAKGPTFGNLSGVPTQGQGVADHGIPFRVFLTAADGAASWAVAVPTGEVEAKAAWGVAAGVHITHRTEWSDHALVGAELASAWTRYRLVSRRARSRWLSGSDDDLEALALLGVLD